jgi:NAD(P)-dependent dehydrogenase (short-subunit alcohol dehydrogenase family)
MDTTNNKAILVTGAGGGIGSVLVPMLLANGWRVYAGVNSHNPLPAHAQLVTLRLDITDATSIAAARDKITEMQGGRGLQAVVNLAGIMSQGPVEIIPESELRRAYDINVFGPVAIIQHFLPLIRVGKGRIINITAVTALASGPFFGPVASSKAALAYLTDSLRMELAPWDIPVVNIMPGAMKTPVFRKASAAFERSLVGVAEKEVLLYRPLIAGATKALQKQKESDPKVAAKVILKAVESTHPKSHYFAGSDAVMAGHLIPFLPRSVKDKMLTAMVGGKK